MRLSAFALSCAASCLALLAACMPLRAQDPNFSQFYIAPAFLNPAFVGTTPHYRLASIYRNQWPAIPQAYETNLVSFEYNWDYYHSGIGVVLSNDRVQDLGYHASTVSLLYAYEAALSKEHFLRFGLQAGYVLRSYGFDRLTFADALRTGRPSAEGLGSTTQGFPNIGAGVLYYSEYFWAGVAAQHLTAPTLQLRRPNGHLEYQPLTLQAHAGGRLSWKRGKREVAYCQPAVAAYWQYGYAYANAGLNVAYLPIMLGIWYRNAPLPGATIQGQPATFTGTAGYKKGYITVVYSYDFAPPGLRGLSWGGHEISVTLTPTGDYRYKGGKKWHNRYIECPVRF
jgi:type IX secretion system PorP/SprF family membrane protein